MSRQNIEKEERKKFQRKLANAINWLEYLQYKSNEISLDYDEEKELKEAIKFLKSLN